MSLRIATGADGTVPVGQYTRAALVNSKMVEGDASKPQDISDSDISKALDGLEINSCANVGAVASAVPLFLYVTRHT